MKINKIIHGDCLKVMREMEENSIDTIITDPPYGIGFMGKEWDTFKSDYIKEKTNNKEKGSWRGRKKEDVISKSPAVYAGLYDQSPEGHKKFQKWTEQWAREALRVTKPGGTILCFSGVRTQHNVTTGIEDAGWVIKDVIMWLYGSGFPKATDISKQLDKGKRVKILVPTKKGNLPKQAGDIALGGTGMTDVSKPVSEEAKLWNGWKSHGLKPAYEPIIVAMKPNNGTYANNALKWGVGGLNIDGGRVENKGKRGNPCRADGTVKRTDGSTYGKHKDSESFDLIQGRFPANIILDEEAGEMLDEQSGISKSSKSDYNWENSEQGNIPIANNIKSGVHFGDTGGASRFFYCAKASKSERGEDNKHPTVKPLKLMEYLCTLTKTPTGGIVLDPFAGSGTTLLAAKNTGREYIGIEKEKEYIEIAEARLKALPNKLF